MEQKEWGEAVRIPQKKSEKPKQSNNVILFDSIKDILDKEAVITTTLTDESITWSWKEEDIKNLQKFRSIAFMILPSLNEAFDNFEGLTEKTESSKIENTTLKIRMALLMSYLTALDKLVERYFNQGSHFIEDQQIAELEQLITWILYLSKDISAPIKLSSLPDFEVLKKEIVGNSIDNEANPDPRVRDWETLESSINENMPAAFSIIRSNTGEAKIKNSPEWREASSKGQTKLLIWTLEQTIIPGIDKGIRTFRKKLQTKYKTSETLMDQLDEESLSHLERCISELDQLQTNLNIAKEYLDKDETDAFGGNFQELLTLKAGLKRELNNSSFNGGSANTILLLNALYRAIQSNMKWDQNYTDTIRAHLLKDLNTVLTSIKAIAHKKNPIHWEYQRENTAEQGKALRFHQLGITAPGILDIPDFSRWDEAF